MGKAQKGKDENMKKMKRFFALFLAMAMVLGMSMTTFAAGTATITVTNAGNAELTMMQIIAPNPETATGWEFVNGAGECYKNAFKSDDEQAILWKLIALAQPTAANIPAGTVAATAGEIQSELKLVETSVTYDSFQNGGTVSEAGVYAIKATEAEFSYSPMAAYVAFGTYNTTTGVPENLADATVAAKKVPLSIDKASDKTDDVVFVGDVVNYTITTTVPYIAENVENVVYGITDTITGAQYVAVDGKVTLNVRVGEEEPVEMTADVTSEGNKQSFRLDLNSIAADRQNANAALVITYQATVTGTVINNEAIPDDGEHTFKPATDVLYTGSLTMTKTGENDAPLAGAEFVIYTRRDNKVVYAVVENGNVTGWTETEADATSVVTEADGTVTVKGFDDSETYYFKEVKAPEGYSINTDDAAATWATDGDGANAATRAGAASMTDTKLSARPSTGGIGTTIFTVGGCAIMILAAGMFFVSRRRAAK